MNHLVIYAAASTLLNAGAFWCLSHRLKKNVAALRTAISSKDSSQASALLKTNIASMELVADAKRHLTLTADEDRMRFGAELTALEDQHDTDLEALSAKVKELAGISTGTLAELQTNITSSVSSKAGISGQHLDKQLRVNALKERAEKLLQ